MLLRAFWLFVDFHTSDEYFPCGGGKQPAGHPYGRRFASTVGTYEAIDLTLGDVQVKVTYRDQVPKLLRKALKMDHRVPPPAAAAILAVDVAAATAFSQSIYKYP